MNILFFRSVVRSLIVKLANAGLRIGHFRGKSSAAFRNGVVPPRSASIVTSREDYINFCLMCICVRVYEQTQLRSNGWTVLSDQSSRCQGRQTFFARTGSVEKIITIYDSVRAVRQFRRVAFCSTSVPIEQRFRFDKWSECKDRTKPF